MLVLGFEHGLQAIIQPHHGAKTQKKPVIP